MARSGRPVDYTWGGSTFQFVTVNATQQFAAILVSGTSSTMFRARGELTANMDVAAADDGMVLGCGLIVLDDAVVAAGATAMPSPATDLNANWWWHSFIGLRALATSNEGLAGGASGRILIDTKAMRKVKQNESIVLVVDAVLTSGSPSCDVTGGVRVLFGD